MSEPFARELNPQRGENYYSKSYQKYFLGAINFVIITKTLFIELEKYPKYIIKIIVSGKSFVIISPGMVDSE